MWGVAVRKVRHHCSYTFFEQCGRPGRQTTTVPRVASIMNVALLPSPKLEPRHLRLQAKASGASVSNADRIGSPYTSALHGHVAKLPEGA